MGRERLGRGRWRTSSYSGSGGGNCVEVAAAGAVLVRDGKDPGGPRLAVGRAAWQAFTSSLKAGTRGI